MFRFKKLREMVEDIDDTLFVQAKALYNMELRLKVLEAEVVRKTLKTTKPKTTKKDK